jgi:hypothetical protein
MVESPRNLSQGARWSLVIGLWVILIGLVALAVRNVGWVQSWANGIVFTCIFLFGLLLTFSLVAAAVRLSVDTIQGRYPYPGQEKRRPAQLGLAAKREERESGTARRSWGKTLLNVAGVGAVTLAMTLGLLEIGLRLFAPQSSPEMRTDIWNNLFVSDPNAIYRNIPGLNTTFMIDESTTRWAINGQGLREDHEIGPHAPGTIRILNMGDSFTFGYGVEANQSFPYLMNESVGPAGEKVESINDGASGYGTHNEAALLEAYGWALQPDVVLVNFYVGNDVRDTMDDRDRIKVDDSGKLVIAKSNLPPAWVVDTPVPDDLVGKTKSWLAHNSHAYIFLRRAFHAVIDPFVKKQPEQPKEAPDISPIYDKRGPADLEAGWEKTTRLLDFMGTSAQAHGAKLVVVMIPTREQVEDSYWQETRARSGLSDENLERDRPQRKLLEWSARTGAAVIDLLPGFRAAQGGPFYFRKDPHWNAAGQRLAATLIEDGLAKMGVLAGR